MSEAAVGVVREGPQEVDYTGFDDFYRSAYPRLHRIALARCGRSALAEELVQETMVKVFARWSKVASYDSPLAYSCRLLVNESIGLRRRQTGEARALRRRGVDADVTLPADADEFWTLARTLPKRQMQVIVLYYAGDRSISDIARTLEVAEGTVRATLAQARDNLRVQLSREES